MDLPVIKPGDIYEDCAFHPVLCLEAYEDTVIGVSLIDASFPRNCSIRHCGVVKLAPEDVIEIRRDFAGYVAKREREFNPE